MRVAGCRLRWLNIDDVIAHKVLCLLRIGRIPQIGEKDDSDIRVPMGASSLSLGRPAGSARPQRRSGSKKRKKPKARVCVAIMQPPLVQCSSIIIVVEVMGERRVIAMMNRAGFPRGVWWWGLMDEQSGKSRAGRRLTGWPERGD